MRAKAIVSVCFALLGLVPFAAQAHPKPTDSPQAASRSNGQNYKDMVLATCIAEAYKTQGTAGHDAGSSAGALREWAYYDMENSPDAIMDLVKRYLAREYGNPLAEAEQPGIRYDLLKCFDLYHSKELAGQVKRFVSKPGRTFRQEQSGGNDQVQNQIPAIQ